MPAILIAALLLAPPEDDPFCDPLKQIVAAATGDYRVIAGGRGEDAGLGARVSPEIEGGWDWYNVKSPDGMTGYHTCFANFEDQARRQAGPLLRARARYPA